MDNRQKLNLYRMFHEQGILCVCNTCGDKNYCACDTVTMTAECFNCAIKRIEREERAKEQLKNFNYEDFIRL